MNKEILKNDDLKKTNVTFFLRTFNTLGIPYNPETLTLKKAIIHLYLTFFMETVIFQIKLTHASIELKRKSIREFSCEISQFVFTEQSNENDFTEFAKIACPNVRLEGDRTKTGQRKA